MQQIIIKKRHTPQGVKIRYEFTTYGEERPWKKVPSSRSKARRLNPRICHASLFFSSTKMLGWPSVGTTFDQWLWALWPLVKRQWAPDIDSSRRPRMPCVYAFRLYLLNQQLERWHVPVSRSLTHTNTLLYSSIKSLNWIWIRFPPGPWAPHHNMAPNSSTRGESPPKFCDFWRPSSYPFYFLLKINLNNSPHH